jgi:hypothetical protein
MEAITKKKRKTNSGEENGTAFYAFCVHQLGKEKERLYRIIN